MLKRVQDIRKNDLIYVNTSIVRVLDISRSTIGKHGYSKKNMTGCALVDDKRIHTWASENKYIYVPVEKVENFQLLGIHHVSPADLRQEQTVDLLDDENNTIEFQIQPDVMFHELQRTLNETPDASLTVEIWTLSGENKLVHPNIDEHLGPEEQDSGDEKPCRVTEPRVFLETLRFVTKFKDD